MSVSDEGHAHPGLDGFVLPVDMTRGSARAGAEESASGDEAVPRIYYRTLGEMLWIANVGARTEPSDLATARARSCM
jgi:hypothetical protein